LYDFAGQIRRYDIATQTMSVFKTVSNYTSGDLHENFGGMYINFINGAWRLTCLYPTNTATAGLRYAQYNFSTGVWSESNTNIGAANGAPQYHYNFGNYVFWAATEGCRRFDLSTLTSTLITGLTGNLMTTVSMCQYRNNIYCLAHNGNSTDLGLYQLVGTWQQVKTLVASLTSPTSDNTTLFTDGTYLYALFYHNSSWRCYQMDASLNITDITSIVLPEYLRVSGLTTSAFKGWHVDAHDDADNPEIWLTYTSNTGAANTTLAWYKWLGPSTQIEYAGDAGSGGYDSFIAFDFTGGGQYSYSQGEPNIQIEDTITASATAGNLDVDVRIYESPNLPEHTMVDVQLDFVESLGPPRQTASLVSVSPSGTIVNGNTARVGATSGTLYTLEWLAAADGIVSGDRVTIVPRVAKTQ
jgi:hypothetical protein